MKTGIQLIADERKEQIKKHGRTVALDKKYNKKKQLRDGAFMLISGNPSVLEPPEDWDRLIWNKMASKSYKNRLVIAGALIAAELDRIQKP